MADPRDLLAQMGITPEEIDRNWYRREKYQAEDRVICSCGHGKKRHTIEEDFVTCNPSKVNCPCGNFVPVLKVADTRDFLSSTKGPGVEHALTRGLRTTLKKDKEAEWIDEHYKCAKCQTPGYEKQLTITPFEGTRETGFTKSTDVEFARYNGFLCNDCWEL